jgi:hypothetical protein
MVNVAEHSPCPEKRIACLVEVHTKGVNQPRRCCLCNKRNFGFDVR